MCRHVTVRTQGDKTDDDEKDNNNNELNKNKRMRGLSLKQIAQRLKLKPHVVKYWTLEFTELLSHSPKGQESYIKADVEVIAEIKTLLYDQGYSVDMLKRRARAKLTKLTL